MQSTRLILFCPKCFCPHESLLSNSLTRWRYRHGADRTSGGDCPRGPLLAETTQICKEVTRANTVYDSVPLSPKPPSGDV